MGEQKKKNIIYIVIGLSVVLLLSLVLYSVYLFSNNAEIKFVVSPNDAKYSINNKEYRGSQDVIVPAGSYGVVFKRELYTDKTVALEVERGKNQTINIKMGLKNLSNKSTVDYDNLSAANKKIVVLFSQQNTDEEGQAMYDSLSPEEQKLVDTYAEQNYNKETEALLETYPIVASLPQYTDTYHIDMTYEGDSEIPVLDITLLTGGDTTKESAYKLAAEGWLKDEDPSYTKLEVRYATE